MNVEVPLESVVGRQGCDGRRRAGGDRGQPPTVTGHPACTDAQPAGEPDVPRDRKRRRGAPELTVVVLTSVDGRPVAVPRHALLQSETEVPALRVVQIVRPGVDPEPDLRPEVGHPTGPRRVGRPLDIHRAKDARALAEATEDGHPQSLTELRALLGPRTPDVAGELEVDHRRDEVEITRRRLAVLTVADDERWIGRAREGRGVVTVVLERAALDLLGVLRVANDERVPVAIRDGRRTVLVVRHRDGLAVRAVRAVLAGLADAHAIVSETAGHEDLSIRAVAVRRDRLPLRLVHAVVLLLHGRGRRGGRRGGHGRLGGRRGRGLGGRRRHRLVDDDVLAALLDEVDVGALVLDGLQESSFVVATALELVAARIELLRDLLVLRDADLLIHVDGALGLVRLGRVRPRERRETHHERGNGGRDRLEERVHVNPYHGRSRVVLQRSFGLKNDRSATCAMARRLVSQTLEPSRNRN